MRTLAYHNLTARSNMRLRGHGLIGGPAAPGPSQYAQPMNLLQNTGIWQFPISQLVGTGNSHTYTKTAGPASVTVGLATGTLSIDTSSLQTNAKVVIHAVDDVTAYAHDFEFDLSVVIKAAADYMVASAAEFATVMANSAATLNGKIIEVTAPISTAIRFTGHAGASVALRSATYAAHVEMIDFAGAYDLIDLSNLHIWHRAWPRARDGIFKRELNSAIGELRAWNAFIHHGYGAAATPWDTADATLPEYAVQRIDVPADVTSTRYALNWNDPTNPYGGFLYVYGPVNPCYFALGDSTVVATASDTLAQPYTGGTPQSPGWGGTAPTHIAVISPSGPQQFQAKVNQGINQYLIEMWEWVGSNLVQKYDFRQCWFDSLGNALKPGNTPGNKDFIVDRCIFTATYQDVFSYGADGAVDRVSFTRNFCQVPFAYRTGLAFADVCDPADPHGDGLQIFSTSNATITDTIAAGNMWLPYKLRAGVMAQADVFLQNGGAHPTYDNALLIGNLLGTGGGNNDMVAGTGLAYGNTAFAAKVPTSETSLGARGTGTDGIGIIARNVSGKYAIGSRTVQIENVETSPGTLTTLIEGWANAEVASGRAGALAELASKVGSAAEGLGIDVGKTMIDWTTADPLAVIRWDQMPGLAGFTRPAPAAPSTLTTSLVERAIIGPIARTVTPEAGVEWRWATTAAGVTSAGWSSVAGTVTPDAGTYHVFVQIRFTSSATEMTIVSKGISIDGYTARMDLATQPATFFTTASTGPYFKDPAATTTPAMNSFVLREYFKVAAFGSPQTIAVIAGGAQLTVEIISAGAIRSSLRDGSNQVLISAAVSPENLIFAGVWHEVIISVSLATQEYFVWVDGVLGHAPTFALTPSANFQTGRNLYFLADNTGGNELVGDVAALQFFRDQHITTPDVSGLTPYKTISGAAATVNLDAWKLGTDAT